MDVPGFTYLGNGPAATGEGPGWRMSPDLYARCPRCGELLPLDPSHGASCSCRTLYLDADAGRFGCGDGDAAVAIYRKD
jgi:hypothetical protein